MPLSDLSRPSTVSPCTSNNVQDLPFGLQGPGHLCRASLLLRLRVLGPWPSPVCPLHPLFARPVCPAPAHPSQPKCCFFKMPFLILQSKSDPPAALFSSLTSPPPVTPTGTAQGLAPSHTDGQLLEDRDDSHYCPSWTLTQKMCAERRVSRWPTSGHCGRRLKVVYFKSPVSQKREKGTEIRLGSDVGTPGAELPAYSAPRWVSLRGTAD